MSNPYHPPNTSNSGSSKPGQLQLTVAIVSTVFTVGVHAVLLVLSFPYATLFADFGADVPFATQLFLPYSIVYFVLPAVCVIALMARLVSWYAPTTLYIVVAALSVLMIPAFLFAVYFPVFRIG